MGDPSHPAFPIASFLAFVLVLIPLPWHIQAMNSGTCLFMIWTAIACLNLFINSVVWHNNVTDWSSVWCDISSRIIVATMVAIPAATLCINRRLYNIAACQVASITKAEKRRDVIIDLCIGVGIPFIQLPLHFIVEGHRYDLIEDIGCYPVTYNTWVAYPLSYVWPNVIGLVSVVYCVLTLRQFMRRRAQFSQLITSNSSFNVSTYVRLMALSLVEIVITTPMNTYGLYFNVVAKPISPWISWDDTHFEYWKPEVAPAALWRTSVAQAIGYELTRWMPVFGAFVFFGFFGFAEEARRHYKMAFWAIAKRLGFKPPVDPSKDFTIYKRHKVQPVSKPTLTKELSLPSYVETPTSPPPSYPLKRSSISSSFCSPNDMKTTYATASTACPSSPGTSEYPKEFEHDDDPTPSTPSTSSSAHTVHDRHVSEFGTHTHRDSNEIQSNYPSSVHATAARSSTYTLSYITSYSTANDEEPEYRPLDSPFGSAPQVADHSRIPPV